MVPLLLLLSSAEARLERQRELRQEVVSERIFDELERELTQVLEREQRRATYGDSAIPQPWEPFIVGYFRTSSRERHLLEPHALSPEQARRMNWALTEWLGSAPPQPALDDEFMEEKEQANKTTKSNSAPVPRRAPKKSSSDVLRQLNRGKEQRRKSRSNSSFDSAY